MQVYLRVTCTADKDTALADYVPKTPSLVSMVLEHGQMLNVKKCQSRPEYNPKAPTHLPQHATQG